MHYTFLILATLSYAQTNSMEGIKEKWSNFCERINVSSISNRINKDTCLEKLNTFGTFLNSGINRLVELTVRNDNYTTKEKAIIGAGTVGAVASIFGAKYVLKKSRLTKIPAPDKQLDLDNLDLANLEESTLNTMSALASDLELGYTINGALYNLLSKKPDSIQSFLDELDQVRDNMKDFLPKSKSSNKIFKTQCKNAFDQKVIEIVDVMQTHSRSNFEHAITKVLYESQAQYSSKRLKFFNASHNLENIQEMKHQKPSQEA